jgi:hypothetical protein
MNAREPLEASLADFLAALGMTAQRFALYPRRHPLVVGLSTSLEAKALAAFHRRRGMPMVLTLSGRELALNETVVQDPSPHIRELARRIRARNLGVVEIRPGVTGQELDDLCGALAEETASGAPPLKVPRDSRNVLYHPMEFDRLTLDAEDSGGGKTPSSLLWLELARSALGVEGEDPRLNDPGQVARAVGRVAGDAVRARELVNSLRVLLSELAKPEDTPEAREVNERLHILLAKLEVSALEQLLAASRRPAEIEVLIRDASEVLGPDAFLKLLRATAPERGETLSPPLARALSKLAIHAGRGVPGVRGAVDRAVQDAIFQLLGGERVDDPSPAHYAAILDGLARESGRAGAGHLRESPVKAWKRTLQMAVEVGTWGPGVADAMAGILEAGQVGMLIEILKDAPGPSEVTERLETWVIRPEAFAELARMERLPPGILEALVQRMGTTIIDPLLDTLALTSARSTRQAVLAALRDLGEPAALRALQRLDDPRWYVVRNRLALARSLEQVPPEVDLAPYLGHEDHRVRMEALELALRIPHLEESAVVEALQDLDHRVVLRALRAVVPRFRGELPLPLLSALGRILNSSHPAEVRILAMTTLGSSSSPQALDLLVRQVARRGLFGGFHLRTPSPMLAEGLRVLARRWPEDPVARAVLRKALRSRDASIRQSALPAVEE